MEKQRLYNISKKYENKEYGRDDKTSAVWKNYSTSTKEGRKVYDSFSDGELLKVLQELAKEINHSPAQKEVFWVFREYIKLRFKKWPYALEKAGLARCAGKGGRTFEENKKDKEYLQQLLKVVADKALELGKAPHPKDVPQVCAEIKKYYNEWGKVIEAAGIKPMDLNKEVVNEIKDLESEYKLMLEVVYNKALELGRAPMYVEADEELRTALVKRCGSWRNALYQIGLEPVVRIRPFAGIYIDHRKMENRDHHTKELYNCHYKLINPSEETRSDLNRLLEAANKLGKAPTKKDVDKELRKRLQESCGSWSNALFQVGLDK